MNTLNVYESVSENCSSSWSFDHFYLNWNLESISWYANEYMKIHMKCWSHCATVSIQHFLLPCFWFGYASFGFNLCTCIKSLHGSCYASYNLHWCCNHICTAPEISIFRIIILLMKYRYMATFLWLFWRKKYSLFLEQW